MTVPKPQAKHGYGCCRAAEECNVPIGIEKNTFIQEVAALSPVSKPYRKKLVMVSHFAERSGGNTEQPKSHENMLL